MTTGSSEMTAEELIRLPRGQHRYELVDGELRVMTPAGHNHGRVAMRIGSRLSVFVEAHDLGQAYAAETGFILRRKPDTVRAPDASFVSHARLLEIGSLPTGFFPGPPDLAIEVISPSDEATPIAEKIADWLTAGCRAIVSIDPDLRQATVHRPDGSVERIDQFSILTVSEVLPGWSVALLDIFH